MTKAKILPTIILACAVLSAVASLTVPNVLAIGTGILPLTGDSSCLLSYMTYPVTIGTCNPISGGVVSV